MERLLLQPSHQPPPGESRIVCRVCHKQFSLYTCPRCNTRYCSLQCYKNHSIRCTESFMRENVNQELKQIQSDDATKQKMFEILKKFHFELERDDEEMVDSSDNENDTLLDEETIQKVLSGNQVRLEELSPGEMKSFRRAIATGELSKMIKPWTPWWATLTAKTISLGCDGTQLVRSISNDQEASCRSLDDSDVELNEVPRGPKDPLIPISKLTRGNPSPLLAVHLVDVIYSYCFTLRLYNGDWRGDPLGAAMVVLSVSNVLREAAQPETVGEALIGCLERACSPAYSHMGGPRFGFALIEDTINLLSLGSNALICGLCDLQRLMKGGQKELKSEKRKIGSKGKIDKLQKADRKAYFLMCWVHEQPGEVWSSLTAIVSAEKASFDAFESRAKDSPPSEKSSSKGKSLIEEVC